jgi:hypothetical protein
MNGLNIYLEGDGAWPDLLDKKKEDIIHLGNGTSMSVAALSNGMVSGRPSIMLRLDLPDGKVVLAETTMRLFLSAADVFRTRYGAELAGRDGDGKNG